MRDFNINKTVVILLVFLMLAASGCGSGRTIAQAVSSQSAESIGSVVQPIELPEPAEPETTDEPDQSETAEPVPTGLEAFLQFWGNIPENDAAIESIIQYGDFFSIALHYPILQTDWVDFQTRKMAERLAKDFKSRLEAVTVKQPLSYELNMDFELYRPYDSIVGIRYELFRDDPDLALPAEEKWARNYNLKLNDEIDLWNLLDGRYMDCISKKCLSEILDSGTFTGDAEILANEKLSPVQKNFSNFILLKDYIVFFFPNIYRWNVDGESPWIAISYAELAPYISRDYEFLIEQIPGNRTDDEIEAGIPMYLEDELEVFGDFSQVAISFDDGPSDVTPLILDILKDNSAQATFFVLGNRVKSNRDILYRMLDEGHEIGNHTWAHKNLVGLSKEQFDEQVVRTQQTVAEVTGYTPKVLRPSYGAIDGAVKQYSTMPIITWSVDSEDWKCRDADIIAKAVLSKVKDGDIILLHDMYPTTVEATEQILHELDGMGFKVVSVSQLLRRNGETLKTGLVYRRNPSSVAATTE